MNFKNIWNAEIKLKEQSSVANLQTAFSGNAPSISNTSMHKTVQDGTKTIINDGVRTKTTVKKVFVKLKEGSSVYRKKRVIGKKSAGKVRAQVFISSLCTEPTLNLTLTF